MSAANPLHHPEPDQINLSSVLAALGDQTRLAIIGYLVRHSDEGMTCGQFTQLASKTSITYHLGKLREAGIVKVQPEGTKRRVTLRRSDLDERFPGFLDSIVPAASALPFDLLDEHAPAPDSFEGQ